MIVLMLFMCRMMFVFFCEIICLIVLFVFGVVICLKCFFLFESENEIKNLGGFLIGVVIFMDMGGL